MLFASFVLLLVLLASFYFYRKWRYFTTPNGIPGPSPEFLIGNMRNTGLLSRRKTFHEVFSDLKRIYGDIFTFWFGPYRCLVFNRVEHAQHILTSRHTYEISDIITANFSLLIPNSMFVSRNETWKRHARVVLPMLKRAKVLQYLDTIVTCTDWFIDTHLTKNDGGRKDLGAKCQALLFDIIGSIVFDHNLEGNPKKNGQEQQAIRQAFRVGQLIYIF
jgi:cytochrome P450